MGNTLHLVTDRVRSQILKLKKGKNEAPNSDTYWFCNK